MSQNEDTMDKPTAYDDAVRSATMLAHFSNDISLDILDECETEMELEQRLRCAVIFGIASLRYLHMKGLSLPSTFLGVAQMMLGDQYDTTMSFIARDFSKREELN